MKGIIFLSLLTLAAAGQHHGDGHDDNCVDISKYGPVEYEESNTDICSYKVKKTCTKNSREVCKYVPVTDCNVVSYTECENIETTRTVRADSMGSNEFLQQNCVISSEKQTLTEVKKMPVCKNVTKQQCDTKWVINEQGEKVWAGNDNCEEVTWEDCSLEDRIVTQEIDVWECTPETQPILFQTVTVNSIEVTTSNRVCTPRADPVCTQTTEEKCKTVEWEDCTGRIVPNCISANFKIPYQEFDHRLRCSVGH